MSDEFDNESSAKPVIEGELTDGSQLARADELLPSTLHVLPLSGRPFFPPHVMPLFIDDAQWLETVKEIGETPHKTVGLVLLRPDAADPPGPRDFHRGGTVVRMHEPNRLEGRIRFVAEGIQRFEIIEWLSTEPPYRVRVDYPEPTEEKPAELKAYGQAVIDAVKELVAVNPLYSEELKVFLDRFGPHDPSPFADFAATLTSADAHELQEILETVPLTERMEKVLILLQKQLEVAKMQAKVRERIQETMTDQQRKFFLKEQLKEIQKELGIAKDDRGAELDRFRERLKTLEPPESARKRIDDEMDKLSVLEVGSPEYSVTRNYLDWMSSLPWGHYSEDHLDLDAARATLDRDHDGLDDVKDRIIEFLAVGALRGQVSGSILLLVGPPGVGKTSVGRSIASALGRKFYRFSLGGMRDEAEVKGHRRTYIGAMPGKFIQAIKEVGTANPVVMLDEIDKVGASYHGDPASALLEVLDPEQNAEFRDHYLDVPFDLSRVLFVCTANQLDTIPGPLLDRMEVIHLAGYITAEKLAIARHHLWPKQLEKAGIKRSRLQVTDATLRQIIEGYAREAGVRNLEKQLGRLVRKAAVKLLKGEKSPIRIGTKQLEDYLGPPVFRPERRARGIGVVTGLAWTALGGATLEVEATRVHGEARGLKLTGQLGDVMKESAEIAYSYLMSHAEEFGADPTYFSKSFLHLHVPEGATPKDGPSAGITMATALLSLTRQKRLPRPVAMTGELTLTGKVLPVGGIREKVTAARRIKIPEIILPEANRRDFDELPEHLRQDLTVHFVSTYPEVVKILLG